MDFCLKNSKLKIQNSKILTICSAGRSNRQFPFCVNAGSNGHAIGKHKRCLNVIFTEFMTFLKFENKKVNLKLQSGSTVWDCLNANIRVLQLFIRIDIDLHCSLSLRKNDKSLLHQSNIFKKFSQAL